MELNLNVGLYQSTNLYMTRELRQAISLLQYSSIELIHFIKEQALENPLIDLGSERSGIEYSYEGRNATNSNVTALDYVRNNPTGLTEHLCQQLRFMNINKNQYHRLYYMICHLTQDGYLPIQREQLAKELKVKADTIETDIALLQSLEPTGIGASDLEECLLLQLKARKRRFPLAEMIVEHYLPMFAERKWRELAKELAVTTAEIQDVYDVIQDLDPRPGSHFHEEATTYIVPDVSVEITNGQFIVMMNDDILPQISINNQYRKLLASNEKTEVTEYVKRKFEQVQWVMKSIQQRQETILLVTRAIVEKQHSFFVDGSLVPLTLKEIADEVGVHESTVSRVTTNKYVQTPKGMFELKSFFVSKINRDTSSDKVKQHIKALVEREDKTKPLSDQSIVRLLSESFNITISRRAIAKYRDELNIPASSKRKRYE
ncbi:RNA polymerase factor sigma-54 [Alkalihalobacillus sp. LMS39]|uniref:RNA polymerase factor sigma-54 n=1 Tax=Alkalihalobacillus sp. LMS39 TaxID=2924032 RepID=UPI001FB4EB14|nr:RNA polymerase factor sigma-54 [Alkalihalobacillus sp. LMS39]UOE93741.1 RNA polymerase factor sigma-54 [Alkalihalobacillus sp. LMS39]